MPPGSDPNLPYIVVVAAVINLLLWNGGGAAALYFIWRRARRVRDKDPDGAAKKADDLAPLFYLLSLLFWPASLVCSILFLREARTARTGAICASLGIAQVVVIAWGVCITVIVFASEIAQFLPA